MNKEEYEVKRAEIFARLAELDLEYIKANTDIEPGSVVIAAGQKCILKKYKVLSGRIYPILHKIRPNGNINHNERINVGSNAKIRKYEET